MGTDRRLFVPNWSTVHHYHATWSRDGTWERAGDRLREMVRVSEGREPDPSGGIIDAGGVRGAPTVTSLTRGYDAGKKISGRKVFGLVDTMGLLIAIVVVVASTSDTAGGIAVFDTAKSKAERLAKLWVDGGFKKAFAAHCQTPPRRGRGRQAHTPPRVRRPTKTLGRRANLGMDLGH